MKLNFAQVLRLVWIEDAAAQPAGLRRQDLIKVFGMSKSQASKDLAVFQKLYPKALTYDMSAKCFRSANAAFTRQARADALAAVKTVLALRKGLEG